MTLEAVTPLHTRLLGLIYSLESIQRGRTALLNRDMGHRFHAVLRELDEVFPDDPRLSSWIALPLRDLEAPWMEDECPHNAISADATRRFGARPLKVGLLIAYFKLKYNDFFDAERSLPLLWDADEVDDLSDPDILTRHTFLQFQVSEHNVNRRRSISCPVISRTQLEEGKNAGGHCSTTSSNESLEDLTHLGRPDQPCVRQILAEDRTCSDRSQDDCDCRACLGDSPSTRSSTKSRDTQADSQPMADFPEFLPQTPRDIPLDWQSPSPSEGPWTRQASQPHQLLLPPPAAEAETLSLTQSTKRRNGARTANANINPGSSGRWWVELLAICPVSDFPVRHLPYPPFRLYHRLFSHGAGSKKRADSRDIFVDALVVVLKVIKTMTFSILGHNMTSGLIKALDFHVRSCKLGPFRLQKALQLQDEANTSQEKMKELLELQKAAGRRLSQLRALQFRRKNRGFEPLPTTP